MCISRDIARAHPSYTLLLLVPNNVIFLSDSLYCLGIGHFSDSLGMPRDPAMFYEITSYVLVNLFTALPR